MSPYDKEHNNTLKNVKEGEPILVLRSQDILAPAIVQKWAKEAHDKGVNPNKVSDALNVAQAMLAWQKEHGCKKPD